MFGSQNKHSVVASIDFDPGADDVIPVFIAPLACEIESAKVVVTNVVNGSTANYFDLALLNGGSAGTATTQIGGTIGGTAGWTALAPVAFTVSSGALAAGDIVTVKYNEEGTGTFASMIVQLDYVIGQA
jgi:hypothetical protein